MIERIRRARTACSSDAIAAGVFPAAAVESAASAASLWRDARRHADVRRDSAPGSARHALRSGVADQGDRDDDDRDAAGRARTRCGSTSRVADVLRGMARRGSRAGRRSAICSSMRQGCRRGWSMRRRRRGASSSTRSARCRSSTRRARGRSTAISDSSCSDSSPTDRGGASLAEQFDASWSGRRREPRAATSDVRALAPISDAPRRADAADGRRRAARAHARRARCTTTTRPRSAASPATPGCSAPRRRSARSRGRCCAPRAATTEPPLPFSPALVARVHDEDARCPAARARSAGIRCCRRRRAARACRPRRSVTSGSPARRCGSIRSAIATSCC